MRPSMKEIRSALDSITALLENSAPMGWEDYVFTLEMVVLQREELAEAAMLALRTLDQHQADISPYGELRVQRKLRDALEDRVTEYDVRRLQAQANGYVDWDDYWKRFVIGRFPEGGGE